MKKKYLLRRIPTLNTETENRELIELEEIPEPEVKSLEEKLRDCIDKYCRESKSNDPLKERSDEEEIFIKEDSHT